MENSKMVVEMGVEVLPQTKALGIRRTGSFSECGGTFSRTSKLAEAAGLFQTGGKMAMIVMCDVLNIEEKDKMESACAVVMPPDVKMVSKFEGLEEITIPAGQYATAILKGPYDNLPKAWNELCTWIKAVGLDWVPNCPATPSFETYLNDPTTNPPEELLTKLHMPLKSAVAGSLVTSKVVDATVEDVYALWENDETRAKMACDHQIYENGVVVPELKLGVPVKSFFKDENGEIAARFEEQYLDIVPNRRLVWLVTTKDAKDMSATMHSIGALEFFPALDNKTLIVASEVVFWYGGSRRIESHRSGYEDMLKKHQQLLSNN